MRCRNVTKQLSAFLDGELPPVEAERIQTHLKSCPECAKQRDALERTMQAVGDLPAVGAPTGLRQKILADLESAPSTREPAARRAHVRRWRVLWPAAAAVLIAAGVFLLSRPMQRTKSRTVAVLDRDETHAPRRDYSYHRTRQEDGRLGRIPSLEAVIPSAKPLRKEEALDRDKATEFESKLDHRFTGAPKSAARPLTDIAAEAPAAAVTAAFDETAPKRSNGDRSLAAADALAWAGEAESGAGAPRPGALEAGEEITIVSADPAAAFARVAGLVEEKGWTIADTPQVVAKLEQVRPAATRRMELLLTRAQTARLKAELAHAGLLPKPPATSVAGKPAAPARALRHMIAASPAPPADRQAEKKRLAEREAREEGIAGPVPAVGGRPAPEAVVGTLALNEVATQEAEPARAEKARARRRGMLQRVTLHFVTPPPKAAP